MGLFTRFTPNTRAKSSEVNANFDIIDVALNAGWTPANELWVYNNGKIDCPTGALSKYRPGDHLRADMLVPLTSLWKFDNGLTDSKGSNNGANIGSPTFANGFLADANGAVSLDGASAVSITDATNLKPTGAFSWSMRFKTSNTGAIKALMQSWSQNTNSAGLRVSITAGNVLKWDQGNNTGTTDGTNLFSLTGTTNVCDGNWHKVTISYQGNWGKIILDGKIEVMGFMLVPAYAGTNYVRIGCFCSSGTNGSYMNGQIDDCYLINGFAVDEKWDKAQIVANIAKTTADITPTVYLNVASVADSQLTVTGFADYVLYNCVISNPFYSHGDPLDWPVWFNYPVLPTAAGGTPPTYVTKFIHRVRTTARGLEGKFVWYSSTGGVVGSGAVVLCFDAPIAPSANNAVSSYSHYGTAQVYEQAGTMKDCLIMCNTATTLAFLYDVNYILAQDQSSANHSIVGSYSYEI